MKKTITTVSYNAYRGQILLIPLRLDMNKVYIRYTKERPSHIRFYSNHCVILDCDFETYLDVLCDLGESPNLIEYCNSKEGMFPIHGYEEERRENTLGLELQLSFESKDNFCTAQTIQATYVNYR